MKDFKRGTVEVATWDGVALSTGLIHEGGLLAVMRGLNCIPWSITHIPTGYRVEGFQTRKRAMEVCRRLARYDWNFRSPNSRKLRTLRPFVRSEVRKP